MHVEKTDTFFYVSGLSQSQEHPEELEGEGARTHSVAIYYYLELHIH